MRFSDYFDASASRCPNNLVLIDDNDSYTYKEARPYVHKVANVLRSKKGMQAGQKVAVYSPNKAKAFLSVLGTNRADLVWFPVNAGNAIETNIELFNFFEIDCLIFDSSLDENVAKVRQQCPTIKHFICLDRSTEESAFMDDLVVDAADEYVSEKVDPMAMAIVMATGGTTGPSKGVVHNHKNFECFISNIMLSLPVDENDTNLVVAPMTHAAGMFGLGCIAAGGCLRMLPGFIPDSVIEAIDIHKIQSIFLPPAALYGLLAHPRIKDIDTSSLKAIVIGASPVSPERYSEATAVFGPVMYEVYGQTENLFPVIVKSPKDYINKDGSLNMDVLRSAGRATKHAHIEIMDPEGNILPFGEKGEIVVRCGSVMNCYYNNPEATEEVSKFGWHHTTDVGIKDERGFITIVDRLKDMIISGGFNVYPVEIENLINGIDEVMVSTVIGTPHEKWGEQITAVIELKPGKTIEPEKIRVLCKETLGSIKAPKEVIFWDKIPLSPVGKVLKREVRETFWKDQDRQV